jgi:VCBS repeat-containing protein
LNIVGNYYETNNARIDIQISGRSAGTGFDVINISGAASFDGTINVSLINNFMPILGDSFKVINYGSYTGNNNLDFTGLILGNGLRLNPIFNAKDLTFVVASSAAPDAKNDAYGVNQNQTLTVNALQGVLANDVHPNNDPLAIALKTGANNGKVTLNSNGSFVYTPNPGFLGTDTFTYKATDVDGDFDLATVTINVTAPPFDQAPTVANPISGVYALLNSANTVINLSDIFTDPDDDVKLITKSILANSNNSLVNASVNNNLLTLSYLPGQTGQANITIQALSDGQSVSETFTVFVQPDGDRAPVVANHIPAKIVQVNAPNSLIDISSVFTDSDNDNSLIAKSIKSVGNPSLFDSVGLIGNQLTIDYAADKYGTANIVIEAESNGKTVTDSFTVYIQAPDIDNAPFVLNPLADFKRRVNAPTEIIDISTVFGDVDNNPNLIMKALFGNTNPNLVNASIAGNQLRLDYNDILEGSSDITILGFSNGKLAQETFTVNIGNRLPVIDKPIADQNAIEGTGFSLFIGDVFIDPERKALTYSFAMPNWLSYNQSTKTLSGTPSNSHVGTAVITVSATDNDGITDDPYASVSDSFNITVLDQPNGTFNIEKATYQFDETVGIASIVVLRQDSSLGEASVQLTTQNITATAPNDYVNTLYNLTFADGETSKSVNLTINNDNLREGGINRIPETFRILLSNVSGGAKLGTQSSAIVNIIDDEPAVTPPVAVNDIKEAKALQTITIDLLNNDYDADSYRLPLELYRLKVNGIEYDPYIVPTVTTALGGIISIFNNNTPGNRADDQLYYTASDVDAVDTFAYTIRDGELETDFVSNLATVNISVTPEVRNKTNDFNVTINGNVVNYAKAEVKSFANQDLNGRFTLYEQSTIDLDGNTWKAIALKDYGQANGYVISADTTLTFDFRSSVVGEIQGIAWAKENLLTTNIKPDNVINIYGFNTLYGIDDFDYTGAGQWQTINVDLSNYDNDVINYLIFVGDDDANNKGDSQFRNIILNQTTTNRRPTGINLNSNALYSGQPVGTIIGTLSTIDPDANDQHTYTLVGGQGGDDNALFIIENNQLKTNSILTRQNKFSYSILVQTTDLGGSSLTKSFNISLVDLLVSPGSPSARLVEAGGLANGATGTSSASIAITKIDLNGSSIYDTTYLTANGWSLSLGTTYTKVGSYGIASFDTSTGVISYSLNNNFGATEALTLNQDVSDSFGQIQVVDGSVTALSGPISFGITGSNDNPSLSSFNPPVETTATKVQTEISFAELAAKGNQNDRDGSVVAFKVAAVNSGTLLIGTSQATATAWAAGINDTVDAENNLYWTPPSGQGGNPVNPLAIDAFTVYAVDNSGAVSASPVTATVNVVCFLAGTMIATPDGERPIESLKPGDLITTSEGAKPVRFLARSTRSIAQLQALGKMPIRINQAAFGCLGPVRDTFMSPSHAIHFSGHLVEAGALINGPSIEQLNDWKDNALTYYNIELECHGLITANGLLVESYFANYRSNGFSRDCWDNYQEYVQLYGPGSLMEEMALPRIPFARLLPIALRKLLSLPSYSSFDLLSICD